MTFEFRAEKINASPLFRLHWEGTISKSNSIVAMDSGFGDTVYERNGLRKLIGKRVVVLDSEHVRKKHPHFAGLEGAILMYYNTWFTIRLSATDQIVKLRKRDVKVLHPLKPQRFGFQSPKSPQMIQRDPSISNSQIIVPEGYQRSLLEGKPVSIVSGNFLGEHGVIRSMEEDRVTVFVRGKGRIELDPNTMVLGQPKSEEERMIWSASSILAGLSHIEGSKLHFQQVK